MQTVNVRQLKNNPSAALRNARQDLVMVMNRDQPDALLIGMEQLAGIPNIDQVRFAIALSLFRDHLLSIGAAAKVAGKSLSDMLTLLSQMGIPVVDHDQDEMASEQAFVQKWAARRAADA